MILIDLRLQMIVCDVCGEEIEISRKLLRDQHGLLEFQDETKRDHRECAKYAHDPERAKLERGFRKRLQRENDKLRKRQTAIRSRCSGK